jgi:hypothetical protein
MQPSLITSHLAATRVDALRRRAERTRRIVKPSTGATR